jgi:D-lactate dehydrogenase
MKVVVYSTHDFEKPYLIEANQGKHDLLFISSPLNASTTHLAEAAEAVCAFVSDDLCGENLIALKKRGINYISLRSAGFNHLNISVAHKLKMLAARVPAYSPYSVAEHAVSLMLALNRKIVRADKATHQLNFSLDGLVGFDMYGKTVGIVGTGKIGSVVAKIMHGFGCKIVACDLEENIELVRNYGVFYTNLQSLCKSSDIITLHLPLTKETTYLFDEEIIKHMKFGVMVINTSRGKLVKTGELITALKEGKIGYFGMDVYEDESLFFEDHSNQILKDDQLARLMAFNNVIITGHQAFLTKEALKNIAVTTIDNLDCFENKKPCANLLV